MLKIGDKAPDFSGVDTDGNRVCLDDFKGKKLVLYFYPKDNTPGCTAEACDLRDNYERFQAAGYEIVGVSRDSEASHKKFTEKYDLPFRLIAEPIRRFYRITRLGARRICTGKRRWGLCARRT